MTRHRESGLSTEDRILWSRITSTVVPLRGRQAVVQPEPPMPASAVDPREPAAPPPAMHAAPAAKKEPVAPRRLDRPLHQKLARGRIALDASVDLHGLTQARAHALLLSFLHQARDAGLRHVLVITGKGSSGDGDGVLRRSVPGWLATGPFRPLVTGFDEAGRNHGGGGALYVRLRRQEARRP